MRPPLYAAAVTPFDEAGRIDGRGVAKLMSWFEAAGLKGVVVAGTNGEGPSLGATEKRDLARLAVSVAGKLEVILGISTSSSDEAVWLCKQAAAAGAKAVLAMPPSYFREAGEEGLRRWFEFVLDRSPIPVILYNFPKRAVALTPALLAALSGHERLLGVKDSSGEPANLAAYRTALPSHELYVGDETLLGLALRSGWTGSISGAANSVPLWLAQVLAGWPSEEAETKFDILLPVLRAIRSVPQPAGHKALLHRWGVLSRPDLRLPLLEPDPQSIYDLEEAVREALGERAGM